MQSALAAGLHAYRSSLKHFSLSLALLVASSSVVSTFTPKSLVHVTNEGACVKNHMEPLPHVGTPDASCSVSRLRAESQHPHQRALLLQGAELYVARCEHALVKEKLFFLSVFFFNVADSRCLAKRVGERICAVRRSDTVAADPLPLHHTRAHTRIRTHSGSGRNRVAPKPSSLQV